MKKPIRNASITFLARKYLGGRSRLGVSRSHILTLCGIALGVMALITVSSVMNGFRADIRERIIGTLSEMRLSAPDGKSIAGYEQLEERISVAGYHAAGVVRCELLLKNGDQMAPALVFGIDAQKQRKLSPVLQHQASGTALHGIVAGSLDSAEFMERGIAIGSGLAGELGLYLGDELQIISPIFNIPTPFGLLPKVEVVEVMAIFSAGMPEYDQSYCFVPRAIAQGFNAYADEVDYIEIRSDDPTRSRMHLKKLQPLFPDYKLEDWSSFDASLYGAIRFEKYLMFIILLFMFIIASFNLTGSLLKTISFKKSELGLLKALGYKDKELRQLFLRQAFMLCTLGIIIGLILSSVLLIIQDRTALVKLDQAIVLPVQIQISDYLLVIAVSYLLTWLSILLPLSRLSKINAVELIRRNA
ncbi:MAG: ABC transporter permease [Candidatus Cloacimonetes bacterium]|jgi:lipoprotein-releasing system permease protein|nr:ABC transporter permease [Candidatus Cloacimonadota bacterium]MDD2506261.1 ABC transporter permease [Candidatus Cloacimonadota bacterium]MDD4559314.1 ABC transporter permease [Candidatus Cloacimonadota bacterium]